MTPNLSNYTRPQGRVYRTGDTIKPVDVKKTCVMFKQSHVHHSEETVAKFMMSVRYQDCIRYLGDARFEHIYMTYVMADPYTPHQAVSSQRENSQ